MLAINVCIQGFNMKLLKRFNYSDIAKKNKWLVLAVVGISFWAIGIYCIIQLSEYL